MRPIPFLCLVICFASSTFAHSQEFVEKLATQLDSFSAAYPSEKTFIHTDKARYISGETIWFKSYITAEDKPTYISKVVYVTLVDDKGKLVEKRMLPINNGAAAGDILLKSTLPTGNYTISCYTMWMLNFPEFIYSRPVYIFNTDFKPSQPARTASTLKIQFMPEGGDAISGLNNRVAFRAAGENGTPINVRGTIVDSKKNKIADINTSHEGMGLFEYTPATGETYSAELTTETGKVQTFVLPAAKNEGITLLVNNDNPNRLFVQLQRSESNKAKYNSLLLVAQIKNEIVYAARFNFDEGQQAAAIPKKDLAAGIMQITVMTVDGQPLAERLAFIANYENPATVVTLDTINFVKRSRNRVSFDLASFKNFQGSMSVTNYAFDTTMYETSIFSALLLTSDLKGHIHNAGYYFKDKDPSTLRNLDLLLMTQGWRRFNWQQIAKGDFPPLKYSVESSISVAGTLTNPSGKPIENGRMDFILKGEDSTTVISTVKVNSKNQFVLSDLNFKKSATLYYQGSNTTKTAALTKVEMYPFYYDTLKSFSEYIRVNNDPSAEVSPLLPQILASKKLIDEADGKILGGVTVTAKKLSPVDSVSRAYATDLFAMSDQSILMNKINYASIWQFLQQQVNGLTVGKNELGQTTAFFTRYGAIGLSSAASDEDATMPIPDNTTDITFFLNEVIVPKDLIESLAPQEIVLVKVWKGPSAYALGAPRGAIAVYTDKTKSGRDWRDKGFEFVKKEGYSVTREFYSAPDQAGTEQSKNDIRSTLFWTPHVNTTKRGKASFAFYNDDVTNAYKIVLNGIDETGKMVTIEKIVTAKKP